MRPLFKLALTALIGCAAVFAYRIYQRSIKRQQKIRRLNRLSTERATATAKSPENVDKSVKKKKSRSKNRLRQTNSDILHPAPFDNVEGIMTVPSKKESCTNSQRLRKHDKMTKLRGSPTDSEIREIENQNIAFESCVYVEAKKADESKLTSKSEEASRSSTESTKADTLSRSPMPSESSLSTTSTLSSLSTNQENSKNVKTPLNENGNSEVSSKASIDASLPVLSAKSSDLKAKASSQYDTIRAPVAPSQRKGVVEHSDETAVSPPPSFEHMNHPGNENLRSISPISESSLAESPGAPRLTMCRCRGTDQCELIADADVPKYDLTIKPDISPTEVIPVHFARYLPINLLEASSELQELPAVCFERPEPKANTYLTPMLPVLNSINAAHYHACLINHLVENYDFFE